MKSILATILLILAVGCASTPTIEEQVFAAELSGRLAVTAALKTGYVNAIDLALIRPAVQSAYALLLMEDADYEIAIAELLSQRLDVVDEYMLPEDKALLAGILGQFMRAVRERADAEWDVDAANARRLTAAFLKGVDTGIGQVTGGI